MTRSLGVDLRWRVVEAVEESVSVREAARRIKEGISTAALPPGKLDRCNLLDPTFQSGLIGATGFVVVGRRIEAKRPASPSDRHAPIDQYPIDQLALPSRARAATVAASDGTSSRTKRWRCCRIN